MPRFIDRSGTITAGGTAQQIMAPSSVRRGLLIQNVSAGDLWFNIGATAVASQPSIKLAAGQAYETADGCTPSGHVSIIGASTSAEFVAKEW